ncbi:MAG: hypothetical protein AB1508_17730 [Pseudomonadota bacterium]
MALKIEDERHEGFGDETAAENAEMAAVIRAGAEGIGIFQLQFRLAPYEVFLIASDLSENRFALFGPMILKTASDLSENRFALFGPML